MIHVGDQIVAPRGFTRLTVGEHLVYDAAAPGGSGFSAYVDPSPTYGASAQEGPTTITTQSVEAAIEGGTSPFSFAWVRTSGPTAFTAVSPSSATTAFRCTGVDQGVNESADFEVTVTDARGRTATATVTAMVSNYGRLDLGTA